MDAVTAVTAEQCFDANQKSVTDRLQLAQIAKCGNLADHEYTSPTSAGNEGCSNLPG
ncbi:hypothetical protein MnBA_05820 [Marinobacterium sp. BA1]|jgi:hypothetical protein